MASDFGSRIFFYSLAGLGAGLYLFFRGFYWTKEKRMIENTPTSKVRSIAMGPVEIYGEAILPKGKVLKSPFSNKDCVYYHYIIEEHRGSGKNSRWVTLKDEEKSEYFYLKDDTGQVLVEPKEAEIEIPADFEFKSSMGKDPPAEIQKFLKSQGINFEGLLGINKTMRFREYYIGKHDKVYIMGTAGKNPFVKDEASQNHEEMIMIQKGKSFYYISDKPEKEILSKYKWKVIGGLFGGFALVIGCLFIIFSYLGIL